MSDGAKVLVAIPAFNEEECIEKTVVELESVSDEFDFIVINDGSRDATLDMQTTKMQCNRFAN